jgi:hypothetical protein
MVSRLRFSSKVDIALAVPLLSLTVILALFPAQPQWDYQPLQSPAFFSDVRLFAVLYYLWLGLLVFLAMRARHPAWGMVLAVLFALVHVGFWTIATPQGQQEGWQKMLDSVVLQEGGRIDFSRGSYFEFPGTGILGATFASMTGLEVCDIGTPLLIWYVVTLAVLLFVLYRNSVGPTHLAVFGVLLAVQGNMMLARLHFHPTFWGILPLIAFLLVLNMRRTADSISVGDKLLMILLAGAVTIFHVFASFVLAAAAAGVYVLQELRRRKGLVALGTVGLFVIMPLAWEMYWAENTFGDLVRVVPQLVETVGEGDLFFYSSRVTSSNAAAVPVWVTIVRTYWWVVLYVVPAIIALKNLVSASKLSSATATASGALLGLGTVSIIATVISPGGHQFFRYVMYGSFLAAPVLLVFVMQQRWRRFLLAALVGAFFLSSFPTMLAHNSTISQTAYHPSEVSAGRFVRQASGADGDSVRLFGETWVAQYFSPSLVPVHEFQLVDIRDVDELRAGIGRYVEGFLAERERGGEALQMFVFSDKTILLPQHLFGITPDDPLWAEVKGDLGRADRVYDNGHTQMYR